MINIIGIGKIRRFKARGYALIETVHDFGNEMRMKSSYSWPEIQYIGDNGTAYRLWKKFGITEFYPTQQYSPYTPNNDVVEKAKVLLEYEDELIPHLQQAKVCNIGWSPSQQKWYGWSHRAIYGFTIDSKVKEGSPAFIPSNKEDFIDDVLNFWELKKDGSWYTPPGEDSFMKRLVAYKEVERKGELGLEVTNEIHFFGRQESREDEIQTSFEPYPEWGKGEWKAETLDDAKQMAIDFARGVG